ncbi:transporter substrate-binding domain-containing protein [Vibrio sp. JC009]|uniref:substrate-binding periplasmic protein n=1 Tax=Vibrio sp. JC009 TaxID=2912314 RepID=UPI0023B09B5C|nr:transporter substrate-binding domain-containing protein [Vibrio sp. JC009]WED24616.1 transporter substrate-binding domain-containing protein [Vibrio sp. JC009]
MSSLILILSFLISQLSYAQNPIVVAINKDAPPTPAVKAVLKRAYQLAGVPVVFTDIPHRRSVLYVNGGRADAEAFRVKGIEKKFHNLVMVDVPLRTDLMHLYVKRDKVFNLDGFESIPKDYTVSYRRGVLFAEYALNAQQLNTNQFTSSDQVAMHLESGRSDAVILGHIGDELFEMLGAINVVRLEPAIHKTVLYHYVHKKHIKLLPLLTEALKQMHENGEIEEINNRIPVIDD